MIIEVSGDILNSKAQVIAHGVAPNDHFNHGLALSLREMWPAMYKDYRHYCQTHSPEPGSIWMWGTHGKKIVNLLTQEGEHGVGKLPGKAKVEYVSHALKELSKTLKAEKATSVAISKLATGVGGLEWSEVKPLVSKYLGDLDIPVYVYTKYEKGVTAEEQSH